MFYLINMISRELAINLGITLVFSIGLFVFFNSKVSRVENKVNSVLEIIQQQQKLINNHNVEYSAHETQDNMGDFMTMEEVLEQPNNDLVEISEDENDENDESESDDSEDSEDSEEDDSEEDDSEDDSENEEKILTFDNNKNNEDLNEELNVEPINLDSENKNIETVTIEPPQNMNVSELLVQKANEEEEVANDSLDEISDLDEEVVKKEITVSDQKPLDKWTVGELKAYAAEKNLKRYKSLTKPKLIELIEKAE